jgi:methanethiol S-methyltransferase
VTIEIPVMGAEGGAYGLWSLVLINTVVFVVFAFSFTKPRTERDWRAFGGYTAFIVALFAEMYGVPLTIYLLSGWMGSAYPSLDPFSHQAGHLWSTLFGLDGNPHFSGLHLLSNIAILAGFVVLAKAWPTLHWALQEGRLATEGIYRWLRHPQYLGFMLIMAGFLLQWPTLLTLAMFPILVLMYARLARSEEAEA